MGYTAQDVQSNPWSMTMIDIEMMDLEDLYLNGTPGGK
jgi:hypothetical protein